MNWIRYIPDFVVGCYSVLRRFAGSVYGRLFAPTDDMAGTRPGGYAYGRGVSTTTTSGQGQGSRDYWGDNKSPNKRETTEAITKEKERFEKMSVDEKRTYYKCGRDYETVKRIETIPEYFKDPRLKKVTKPRVTGTVLKFDVDGKLNEKISLWTGDITTLEIDVIVNAANSSLLGGGGVDGCIHRAAGSFLKKECATLHGCDTGDCKITCGFKLPAKHVLHTVGPMGRDQKMLESCYKRCLDEMKKNRLRTIVSLFYSLGAGYPNEDACKVALRTVRTWLEVEGNASQVDRIIFCLFLEQDIDLYEKYVKAYFPLETTQADGDSEVADDADHHKSGDPGLSTQQDRSVDKHKREEKTAAGVDRLAEDYESAAEKKEHRKSGEPGASDEHHRSMEKREGGDKTLADVDRRAEDSMSTEDDGPAAGTASVKAGKDAEVGRSAEVKKSPKGGDSTSVGNSKKDGKPTGGDKCPKEEKSKKGDTSKKDTKSTEKGKSKKDGKSGEVKSSGDGKLAEDGKTTEGGNSKKGSFTTGDDKSANSGKVKKTTKPGLAKEGETGKDVDEDKSAAADKTGVGETAMDVDVSAGPKKTTMDVDVSAGPKKTAKDVVVSAGPMKTAMEVDMSTGPKKTNMDVDVSAEPKNSTEDEDSQKMRTEEVGHDAGEEEAMECSQEYGTAKKDTLAREESAKNPAALTK